MRRMKIVIYCAWLILITVGTSSAQGWRGLVPLHSTREDVERVIGTPTDYYYNLSNETVLVEFSSGSCKDAANEDSYKVPADTVTRIMVIPKSELPLKTLNVDITRYKKSVDGEIKEHVFYYKEGGGESIEVFDGKVQSLTYTPLASEASFRCYSSVEEWMNANNVVCRLPARKFDELDVLPISEEQLRLSNLALQLKSEQPMSRGWIMVYGGKKEGMKAAVRRAKRIKQFLVKQEGVASGRVLTMVVGIRDEPFVELWLTFVGQTLPGPQPIRKTSGRRLEPPQCNESQQLAQVL
jgi:hypothetical protein